MNFEQDKKSSSAINKFERVEPTTYFRKIQKLCHKKCLTSDISNDVFSTAEKNCIDRCIFKFKEAEEFGYETFQYYKMRIKMSQDQI